MFETLTERLGRTIDQLRGRGRLSEENIRESLREVRMALLEADVALPVVRDFVDRVREKAVGQDVLQSLSPGQELVRVVRDELVHLMGDANVGLDLNAPAPVVVMVAGLQGSGKTTSVAKLARRLREREGKQVIIDVSDNGKGIDRRQWKNVFRPGYSTKKRGWGLGLSLAKRIIEDYHGGALSLAQSKVGQGTTFRIEVPAA